MDFEKKKKEKLQEEMPIEEIVELDEDYSEWLFAKFPEKYQRSKKNKKSGKTDHSSK